MSRTGAHKLDGCRILVVEDAYFVADDIRRALIGAGAEVAGPAATVAEALAHVHEARLHAAILDINLDGELSYPIAEALADQSVPFLFATGYDDWALPERWRDCKRLAKPFRPDSAVDALHQLIRSETAA